MRICIIDDNALLADAIAFGLRDRGHEVTLAKNGDEGIAAVQGCDYDVVVIDWQMPGMRGDVAATHPVAVPQYGDCADVGRFCA